MSRVCFILLTLFLFLSYPSTVDTANFTNASTLLSNPRLSYVAALDSIASGRTTVTIKTSGAANINTTPLVVNDTVCFADSSLSSCRNNLTYTIRSILDAKTVVLDHAIDTNVQSTDFLVSFQTTTVKSTFTTVLSIPVNGSLVITIPSNFGLNSLTSSAVSIEGCSESNWSTPTIHTDSTTNNHMITFLRASATCDAGSTIIVTIGQPGIRNPTPISNHVTGKADLYAFSAKSYDENSNVIDEIFMKVAPIESTAIVGAVVGEGLSLQVTGVTATSGVTCGVPRSSASIHTTTTAIPWGTITTSDSFLDAAQSITVSTNSTTGYNLTIEENDQMGRDGGVCPGGGANENSNCIQDTTCSLSSCTESQSSDWTDPTTFHGLGYTLENTNSTDATFTYNESGRTYSARHLPDQEAGQTKQTIMSSTQAINNSKANVCYRLSIAPAQPAGYYYNTVRYTVTANF